MGDFNLFEAHEASGDEERREAARAGDKLAAAISEVRRQFGSFLFQAADRGDFEDRVALCKDDMIRTVNAHVMPVTGTMRRVVRAVREDWEDRLAADAPVLEPEGDFHGYLNDVAPQAESNAESVCHKKGHDWDDDGHGGANCKRCGTTYAAQMARGGSRRRADAPVLDPEGDFHGYLQDVAPQAESKAGENFVTTGPVHEWDGDPADTDFAKAARRRRAGFDSTQSIITEFDTAAQTWADSGRDDDKEYLEQVRQELLQRAGEGDEDAAEWADSPMSGFGTPESMQDTSDMIDGMGFPSIRRSRRQAGYGAKSYDIAGYQYQGDHFMPQDLIEYMVANGDLSPAARDMDPEEVLDQHAGANGIDRYDENTFDSGEFPKVIFNSDVSEDDADWYREGRRGYRTAGGDPLGTAAEAITQELQEQAEQFQQAIEPLQQALQAVDYAQQVQQSQQPLNVQPGEGTVQVIPERNPVPQPIPTDAQGVMPQQLPGPADPNDPYGQGGDPSQQQQQVQARRRRAAESRSEWQEAVERGRSEGMDYWEAAEYADSVVGGTRKARRRQAGPFGVQFTTDAEIDQRRAEQEAEWWNQRHERLKGEGKEDQYERELAEHYKRRQTNPFGHTSSSRGRRPLGSGRRANEHGGLEWAEGYTPDEDDVRDRKRLRNPASGELAPGESWGRRPLGDRRDAAIQKNWWQAAGGGPVAKQPAPKMPKYPGTPTPPKPKTVQAARSVSLIGGGNTHRPAGWEWDRHLLAFKANGPRLFTCSCGSDLDMPGYRKCGGCGKVWNGYAIGHGGDTRTAQADTYLVREIPVRKDVILASRREAAIRQANRHLVGYDDDPQWYKDQMDSLSRKPSSQQNLDEARREFKRWVSTSTGNAHDKAIGEKLRRRVKMFENDVAREKEGRQAGRMKDLWMQEREAAGEDPEWDWPSDVGQAVPKVSDPPVDWHRRDSGGKWTPPGVPAKRGGSARSKGGTR